jgi:hypothetical protein
VQALFVTMSDPPTAVPLYAPLKPTSGFRSPSKQQLSALDESLNMSPAALAAANENARLLAVSADRGGFGTAASDIH